MTSKIIILHGLNNTTEAFQALASSLTQLGFEYELIPLPGHGETREEAKNLEQAIEVLDQRLQPHLKGPYYLLAFSQGAMYFQLWMSAHKGRLPEKQILLAPAISIKNHFWLKKIFETFPKFFPIKSTNPKPFRKYPFLFIWEYRLLIEGIERFQKQIQGFPIQTILIVDPKDELINAIDLKQRWKENVVFFPKDYLKGKRPGKYHILFHPEYFSTQDWKRFIELIKNYFLNDSV